MNKFLRYLLKFVGAVLAFILILQMAASLVGDHYAGRWLKNNIRSSSDSLYTLHYDDLDIGILGRSIEFHNLRFQTDTTALADTLSTLPAVISANIQYATVKGISLWNYFLHHTLSVSAISFTKPKITFTPGHKNTASAHTKTKHKPFASVDSSIYASFSKKIHALSIHQFSIHDGQFFIKKNTAPGDSSIWANKLNFRLRNIHIDSATARSERLFITDDIDLNIKTIGLHLSGKFYRFTAHHFSLSSEARSLSADSIQLHPRYAKYEFSRQKGHEIDRIMLDIAHIGIHQIDFDQSINQDHFYAKKGEILKPRLQVFHDKSMPPGPPGKPKPLPYVTFKHMGTKIKMDTLNINHGYISYSEQKAELNQPGTVSFEDISATFSGISNYKKDRMDNYTVGLKTHSKVMGIGNLKANFTFPMGDNAGQHHIEGTLGPMEAIDFNRATENIALVRLKQGIMHKLSFSMNVNKYGAHGWLTVDYEHLGVEMLKIKAHHAEGKKSIKSFIANTFVVRKNNHVPPLGKAAIRFKRTEPKSIFNLWWKGLLSGIKEQMDVF